MENNNTILAIDIGSSKIKAAVCTIEENNTLELQGIGSAPSEGFHLGNVTSLSKLVESIKAAGSSANLSAGRGPRDAIVGITGVHIKSYNCQGVYYRNRSSEEITKRDLEQVQEAAKASSLFPDREIIHIAEQNYFIDDQNVVSPIGMIGKKLTGEFHFVTGSVSVLHNIKRAVNFAEYNVRNLVFNGLASATSVLNADEEKKMGIIVADIGEATTDISLFINGSLWHTGVVMLGGFYVSRDLAVNLRVPFKEAERIKKEYGNVMFNKSDDAEIEISTLGSKPKKKVKLSKINEIITARMVEIFEQVAADIINSKLDDIIPLGIMFTGGTSKMKGLAPFAESMLTMPAYCGSPKYIKGQKEIIENPENATVLGLLKYGFENLATENTETADNVSAIKSYFNLNTVFNYMKDNYNLFKETYLK